MTTENPAPAFTTRLLGETEKTLNAFLLAELAGTGLTEQTWIALTLTVLGGGIDEETLVDQLAGSLKRGSEDAEARVSELAAAGLVTIGADATVTPTEAGRSLHARIRARVTEITERMWGDLPAADLATTARVLSTILARANGELGRA